VFAQEPPVGALEVRDAVENIPPKIEVIPLVDDPVVGVEGELGASIDRRAGIFIEHHDQLPLEKDLIRVCRQGEDFHAQLFTTPGEAGTHGFEFLDSLNPLNAVLKNDIFMIIREDVRPVRLAFRIIGPGPEFPEAFCSERLQAETSFIFVGYVYEFHLCSRDVYGFLACEIILRSLAGDADVFVVFFVSSNRSIVSAFAPKKSFTFHVVPVS
jgi:hypothetical protein